MMEGTFEEKLKNLKDFENRRKKNQQRRNSKRERIL